MFEQNIQKFEHRLDVLMNSYRDPQGFRRARWKRLIGASLSPLYAQHPQPATTTAMIAVSNVPNDEVMIQAENWPKGRHGFAGINAPTGGKGSRARILISPMEWLITLRAYETGPEIHKTFAEWQALSPMKNGLTKGESETAIRNAVIKFEQEFMGCGPTEVKAFILRDMVLVRLKGVLTPAERQLAKNAEGVDMVKRVRQNLISQGQERLCSQISAITGIEVTGLFTDIETHCGERMIVFTLERDIDNSVR